MKALMTISALLLVGPTLAADGEGPLELSGFVSAWTQDCSSGTCGLPAPGEFNRPVTLSIKPPAAAGEAASARASLELALPDGSRLPAEITLYAVCPYGGKDGCAGRYFQAQVTLGGRAGAFCASSLNAQDFLPFPVTMCAGSDQNGRRYGVTLHRLKFGI
ncbi:MAG: hypothetical protein M0025_07435 [Elusimicrobia bacterium]|nr:hypothetical protein [Elusimicrobiota bacterium]